MGGGRVPLTLHLLSPARRPVQVTRDLAGFWRTTYFEVRKDLKGRYPKHHWPDDPLLAEPTRHAKRQRLGGELEGTTGLLVIGVQRWKAAGHPAGSSVAGGPPHEAST